MRDDRTVIVKGDSAGPIAWIVGLIIVVAAILFVLFYWHPWNTSTTTNTNSTTTITQPGSNSGSTQKSNSTSTSSSQP